MTFQKILTLWRKLAAGDPTSTQDLKKALIEDLLGPKWLWFAACVDWLNSDLRPQGIEATPELHGLLKWADDLYYCLGRNTDGYLTRVALAHIHCTKAAACARDLRAADPDTVPREALRLMQAVADATVPGHGEADLSPEAEQLQEAWLAPHSAPINPADRAYQLLPEAIRKEAVLPVAFLRELTACLGAEDRAERMADSTPRPRDRLASVSAFFVTVPTLMASSEKEGEHLYRIDIEVLPGGMDEVFIVPEQAFVLWDSEFRGSFAQAMRAVENLLEEEAAAGESSGPPKYRGSDFRVRISGGQHTHLLCGPSAGGALARALYFAITGKSADDGIIVMAGVGARDLIEVGGMKGKVEAVARWNKAKRVHPELCFDTIVVASETAQATAQGVLDRLGIPSAELRVGTPECLLKSDNSSPSGRR